MRNYLAKNSNTVDLLAAEKSRIDLSKYDLIIIGSAIHGDNPHPKVIDFVNTNKDELNKKKIAIFIVCGTITSTKKNKRDNALTYPDKIGKGLNPISKVVFAGNMPSSGKKFDEFLAKHLLGIVTGDYRDWVKIKKWVNDVAKI
jgi:menaquinone-dependent protoporphyrinogen oxidase